MRTDVESELEFKESFRLRIHGGKEVTLFLWSFILFSEAHIQEVFFTRRAEYCITQYHGPSIRVCTEHFPNTDIIKGRLVVK